MVNIFVNYIPVEVIVKKFLFLLLVLPMNILMGMESKYSFKKSCNLGFFGIDLSPFDCYDHDRWEAFDGEKCIGSVAYNYEKKCVLNALWIIEEYRGKNIGKTLFLKALEDMKDSGCKKITWRSEKSAIAFYKKLGAKCGSYFSCDNMYIDIKKDK